MATTNPVNRVLVIASDEPMAEIVPAMLREHNYSCHGIWKRKAILQVLRTSKKYDLLFCQVSALEKEEKLLKWVLGPLRDIPLVACASRPPDAVPKVIYDRCTFLPVPFEKQQLVAVVQEALRGVRQIRG